MQTTISRVAKRIAHMADANSLSQALSQVIDVKKLSHQIEGALTNQKDALVSAFSAEFSHFLSRIVIADELKRALKDLKMKVTVDVGFSEKNKAEGRKSQVKGRRKNQQTNRSKS